MAIYLGDDFFISSRKLGFYLDNDKAYKYFTYFLSPVDGNLKFYKVTAHDSDGVWKFKYWKIDKLQSYASEENTNKSIDIKVDSAHSEHYNIICIAYKTVVFDKGCDDATGTMSSLDVDWHATNKPTFPENKFSRNGYSFVGWSISLGGEALYHEGDQIPDDVDKFYAVWVCVKILKGGTGDDFSENVDDVGTLIVKSSEDGYDVPISLVQITETISDGQRNAWLFAPQPNTSYRVSCELGTDKPDKLWAFGGISSSEQSLIDSGGNIVIGATLSNHVVNANFSRRACNNVTTCTQAEADSILPDGISLAITTPATPDFIEPGQVAPYDYGQYIPGQPITATAQFPTGLFGWELKTARLQVGGTTDYPIPNYVHGNRIDIPSSVFLKDIRIIGIFGQIDCTVGAKSDEPSADAVRGVEVRKYSSMEQDWIPANDVKYGDIVRVYATVDTERGYALDGIYANGVKIATEIPAAGYVGYKVEGDTEFVVKAKVRVSIGVGHWLVEDGTWTDGDCSVVASVGGAAVESPADGFDVVLGQTVAYEVDIRSGWHFDAWFNGTEASKPTTFDNPVDMSISDAALAPTRPIAVIARVTDKIIEYKTSIAFANNDDPMSPVDITADTANVTSYPESDEVEIDNGNVVLTYSSGTKPVALTFAENIGNLFFEGLQEFVRNEWVSAVVEGTTYSMQSSKNRTLRALYTTAGERTVTVAYANIQNVSPGAEELVCGEIGIVESTSADGKTLVAERGTPFTLRAIPRNGWSFIGWYYDPLHVGVPKYTGQEASANISSTRTLYAYFEPDTHAVYEWEGSNENKQMTWRSKTYAASKPFNPSACRVDGLGYSPSKIVELTVDMFSAPDINAKPTGSTTLTNIASQDARRLPVRRMERYMQMQIKANVEIDTLLVGTSMGGLAI